jgi:AraC-like DNA-binding protein
MSVRREYRESDSPFVETIKHVQYEGDEPDVTTPDGLWDIVVMRRHTGKVLVLQTGLITRPVQLDYQAGDAYVSITFKPGVFMPQMPGVQMVDRGLVRPLTSSRSFLLDNERLEIPDFHNAEGLVDRLVRRGLLVRDELVEGVVEGRPKAASPRTVQRHFLHAVGLTAKQLSQIQRARTAVTLLQAGRPPIEVAIELGYADQPHLTRSLKRLMGRTPAQIALEGCRFCSSPDLPGTATFPACKRHRSESM